MEASGIDWKAIAVKQREEYLAAQAEAKALAQQEIFENAQEEEALTLDDAGVVFEESYIPEEEEEAVEIETQVVEETAVEDEKTSVENDWKKRLVLRKRNSVSKV